MLGLPTKFFGVVEIGVAIEDFKCLNLNTELPRISEISLMMIGDSPWARVEVMTMVKITTLLGGSSPKVAVNSTWLG